MVVHEGAVDITIDFMLGSTFTDTYTVKALHKGDAFGETALQSKNGKRTAHAYARQPSKLLVIDAEPFLEIQEQYNEHLRKDKLKVLARCKAFHNWDQDKLNTLCDKIVVRLYESHKVILEQGKTADFMYLICGGVVKVLKAIPPDMCEDFIAKNDTRNFAEDHQIRRRPATSASAGFSPQVRSNASSPFPNRPGTSGLSRTASPFSPDGRRAGIPAPAFESNRYYKAPSNEQEYVEKTPGLWVTQRNWKDMEDEEEYLDVNNENKYELLVGILGSGQLFGELAVLDPERPSPVTILAYTNVELYAISKDVLKDLDATFNVTLVNALNESMMMHNPHNGKLAHYFGDKVIWEYQKSKVLEAIMPGRWFEKRENDQKKMSQDAIRNSEVHEAETRGAPDFFIADGNRLRKKAGKLSDLHSDEKTKLYEAALNKFTQARLKSTEDRTLIPAFFGLGQTLKSMDRVMDALRNFDQALALAPTGAVGKFVPGTIQNSKACCLMDMRRFDEALDCHFESLTRDNRNIKFKRDLQTCENLLHEAVEDAPEGTQLKQQLMRAHKRAQTMGTTLNKSKVRRGGVGTDGGTRRRASVVSGVLQQTMANTLELNKALVDL